MSYIEQIDKTRIPQHVAIIMDGNGRWAKQRGEERTYGHRAGAETVQKITEDAARLGIKYLLNRELESAARRDSGFDESIARIY